MEILSGALLSFKCKDDKDIETFLNLKAIEFEKRDWCRVWLILNHDSFENNKIKIEAYFTLSHKTILISDDVSNKKRERVGANKESDNIHFVLIGQLGKYIDDDIRSYITSKEILDMAFSVIYKSYELIAFRCVLIECSGNLKVLKIYENYGFEKLQVDDNHNQLYKRIVGFEAAQ